MAAAKIHKQRYMGRTTTRPFYTFSSRNKKGNTPDPTVFRNRNLVLSLYWEQKTLDEIAAELDMPLETVRDHIRAGRKSGDERAEPRTKQKRIMQANVRRRHIIELAKCGMTPQEIAKRLSVHPRLVQMRLKEASV